MVEKVLHGVRKDLVNGNLSPPVLHPDVGPTFQQLTDHILNMAILKVVERLDFRKQCQMCFLKILACKWTLRQLFICMRPPPQ